MNYFKRFLVFVYTVSSCVPISAFASLVGVPVGIASSAVELQNFAITAGIKKHRSVIKKARESMIKYCRQQELIWILWKFWSNWLINHHKFILFDYVLT